MTQRCQWACCGHSKSLSRLKTGFDSSERSILTIFEIEKLYVQCTQSSITSLNNSQRLSLVSSFLCQWSLVRNNLNELHDLANISIQVMVILWEQDRPIERVCGLQGTRLGFLTTVPESWDLRGKRKADRFFLSVIGALWYPHEQQGKLLQNVIIIYLLLDRVTEEKSRGTKLARNGFVIWNSIAYCTGVLLLFLYSSFCAITIGTS